MHLFGVIDIPYFVAAEAAADLRTTVQGIYALVKRGKLKPMPGRPDASSLPARHWTAI